VAAIKALPEHLFQRTLRKIEKSKIERLLACVTDLRGFTHTYPTWVILLNWQFVDRFRRKLNPEHVNGSFLTFNTLQRNYAEEN
jgi:hypothetical protein